MQGATRLRELPEITPVILAGGLGTRLRTLVADTPKVLARVNGRPFLEYVLEQLIDFGMTEAVLCTGYMGDQVRNHFGDKFRSMSLRYSQEQTLLGTAGALRFALPQVRTETLLVLNGDSICDVDLMSFFVSHAVREAEASLLVAEVDDTKRFGRVSLSDEGKVERFEEKGCTAGRGLINAGVYLIGRPLIESLPRGRAISLEREVFPSWIGGRFFGHKGEVRGFIDIGTPNSYQEAQSFVPDELQR